MSINIRSREFPNTLTKMLASQEGMNTAMSLQGDDAMTLVEILDQVSRPMTFGASYSLIPRQAFDAPNMDLETRRKSVHILRRICGSQTILPRSCMLSYSILKESDIPFASGGFVDVWRGRHSDNLVCIKASRVYRPENLSKIKQVCSQ